MQEANLATRFNPLFWQCACLSVNAGSSDTSMGEADDFGDEEELTEIEEDSDEQEEKKKVITADYGKIARATANAKKQGTVIAFPDINKAEKDFIPDIEQNAIIFSLLGVTGVNSDLADTIIANRPYRTLSEFITKVNPTNVQMLNLIKSGAFDSIYPTINRKAIMEGYLEVYAKSKVEKKQKLTMANYDKALAGDIVPDKFKFAKRVIFFKKWCDENEYDKALKIYAIRSEASQVFFKDYYLNKLTFGKNCEKVSAGYNVKSSAFKKITDEYLAELKEWLLSEEAIDLYYNYEKDSLKSEIRDKYCSGSISKWEMDSLHYYYHEHELSLVNQFYYGIKKFYDLPEELKPVGTKLNKKGEEVPVYDVCAICGTVINADNNKHIVTIVTNFGEVVDVKFYQGQYIYYNKTVSKALPNGKKEVIDKSWFQRGNLLLISGVRRENSFVPKTNWDKGFRHSVQLITQISSSGTLTLENERKD